MYNTFWNTLAIEMLQLLDEMRILEKYRSRRARRLRILVVTYRGTSVCSEVKVLGGDVRPPVPDVAIGEAGRI
jgi:hypothetical protein